MNSITLWAIVLSSCALAIATAILIWSFQSDDANDKAWKRRGWWKRYYYHDDGEEDEDDEEEHDGWYWHNGAWYRKDEWGRSPYYARRPPDEQEYETLPVNVRSRGPPTEYTQVGTLSRVDPEDGGRLSERNRVLPLYGRQTYSRSHRFNYYTVLESGISIPLNYDGRDCTKNLGCEEIYDDYEVDIEELGATYRVALYNTSPIRYIPY